MKGFQGFQGFVAVLLTAASASVHAAGSGPYLPSGWRPEGPAFFLPGEVHESPAVPLKAAQETSVAGSESLREYGPPKIQEVSQDITQQSLPDEGDAPPFFIIRTDISEDITEFLREATTERETEEEETLGATEATVEDNIENQTEAQAKSTDFDSVDVTQTASKAEDSDARIEVAENANIKSDDVIVSDKEDSIQTKSENNESVKEIAQVRSGSDTIVSVEEYSQISEEAKQEESVDTDKGEEKANANEIAVVDENKEEKKVVEVNNIAEAIVNLEAEAKPVDAGSAQPVPEGFLEYGPPGFKEYGPPKSDVDSVIKLQQSPTDNEVGNNEAKRRRRFSPKFKTILSRQH